MRRLPVVQIQRPGRDIEARVLHHDLLLLGVPLGGGRLAGGAGLVCGDLSRVDGLYLGQVQIRTLQLEAEEVRVGLRPMTHDELPAMFPKAKKPAAAERVEIPIRSGR